MLRSARRFRPPPSWLRLTTLDAHAAGEPLRIVTGGFPELEGATMLERRRFARERCDPLRRALLWEPRGHADMYGCVPTPPASADGDLGVLFLHNEGWSTMCGHGILALVGAGLQAGLLRPRDEGAIRIDTPAGRVVARATRSAHDRARVERASFRNVPAFVLERDLRL